MSKLKNYTRGFGSPGRYFQGLGLLADLNKYTALYGKKYLQ